MKQGKSGWKWLSLGWLPLLWLAILILDILAYAGQSDSAPAETAIVLGAAVAEGKPTPVFAERIRHGVQLYHGGRVRSLVLTGGVGAGDSLAESEVARAFCLAHRVPAAAIRIETRSRTTEENLRFARSLVRPGARVLIVTDPLHARRSVALARDLCLDAHPSPTPSSRYIGFESRLSFLLRELWFYAGDQIRRRPIPC